MNGSGNRRPLSVSGKLDALAFSDSSIFDKKRRGGDFPSRALSLVLKHLFAVTHASNTGTDNSNNAVIECLCVNRNWLSSTAALLYRTVDVSQSAVNITKLTSTLLDPNALLPYSMLVKSIKCIPPFHPDQEAGSLEDEAAIPDIHLSPLTNSIEQINHNQLYQEADAWIEMGDLDTLLQLCPLVTSFTWIASPMASNILVQSLADNTHRLTSLSLRECPVTDLLIQTLCISTRKLVHIDLSYTLVSIASAITILDHCTHISKLILEGVSASLHPVPFSPLDNPSKTRPLKFLNLRNSGVSDVHLRAMAVRAPHLVHARLEGCASLTDDAVVALSRTCERLEVLDLSLVSLVSVCACFSSSWRPERVHVRPESEQRSQRVGYPCIVVEKSPSTRTSTHRV